jgi:hypothetical protein
VYSFGDDYSTSERAIFAPCGAQADSSLVKMLSILYNVFSIYIHLKYRGKKHIADFLVIGKQEQSTGHGCVKDPPGHCSAWVDCMALIKYHKA